MKKHADPKGRQEAVKGKFKPMGDLKNEKTKECHFTPKIFSPRDGKKRKWRREHFCPAKFLSPPDF
jgi:hypothetical protein